MIKNGLKKFSKETKIVIVCLKGAERSKEGAIITAKRVLKPVCGGTNEWLGTSKECSIC